MRLKGDCQVAEGVAKQGLVVIAERIRYNDNAHEGLAELVEIELQRFPIKAGEYRVGAHRISLVAVDRARKQPAAALGQVQWFSKFTQRFRIPWMQVARHEHYLSISGTAYRTHTSPIPDAQGYL